MRLLGMILALGAIVWVMLQAAGGGEAESVVPLEQQKALDKARGVEQALMESTRKELEKADESLR